MEQVMEVELRRLEVGDRHIGYRLREGSGPTLLFLPGYGSDMEGTKALALDRFAALHGYPMLRFDYSGTGSSSGEFTDGTLDRWVDEATAALDQLTNGQVVLVGSSMGGWIALHLALRRAQRIRAILAIACAADFTQWGFTAEAAAQLGADGPITRAFWESGQRLLLLNGQIEIDCPVRLVHGEIDPDVPLDVAFRTLRALRSADVQLTVLKGGQHRLSQPHEIDTILQTVANLLEPIP
jgi:pimeloyl-ACP methyl ester carboxylesterase